MVCAPSAAHPLKAHVAPNTLFWLANANACAKALNADIKAARVTVFRPQRRSRLTNCSSVPKPRRPKPRRPRERNPWQNQPNARNPNRHRGWVPGLLTNAFMPVASPWRQRGVASLGLGRVADGQKSGPRVRHRLITAVAFDLAVLADIVRAFRPKPAGGLKCQHFWRSLSILKGHNQRLLLGNGTREAERGAI